MVEAAAGILAEERQGAALSQLRDSVGLAPNFPRFL